MDVPSPSAQVTTAVTTAAGPRLVRDFMSRHPVFVAHDETVLRAHGVMREHGVRHLPVLQEGELVGLLTESDVHLVESLRSADPAEETVESAMQPDPYIVDATEPLGLVVEGMVRGGHHAAVVLEGGMHVVGVFTHTDALKAFLAVLDG